MLSGVERLESFPYTILGCARCGADHVDLPPPKRFERRSFFSDGEWTHWWLPCPFTGDPVLVGLREADGTTKSREEIEWPT